MRRDDRHGVSLCTFCSFLDHGKWLRPCMGFGVVVGRYEAIERTRCQVIIVNTLLCDVNIYVCIFAERCTLVLNE